MQNDANDFANQIFKPFLQNSPGEAFHKSHLPILLADRYFFTIDFRRTLNATHPIHLVKYLI